MTFTASGITLGRAPDCSVVFQDDKVSRRHVLLAFDGDDWWAIDLQSRNGLKFARKKIQVLRLAAGMELVFGNSSMRCLEA